MKKNKKKKKILSKKNQMQHDSEFSLMHSKSQHFEVAWNLVLWSAWFELALYWFLNSKPWTAKHALLSQLMALPGPAWMASSCHILSHCHWQARTRKNSCTFWCSHILILCFRIWVLRLLVLTIFGKDCLNVIWMLHFVLVLGLDRFASSPALHWQFFEQLCVFHFFCASNPSPKQAKVTFNHHVWSLSRTHFQNQFDDRNSLRVLQREWTHCGLTNEDKSSFACLETPPKHSLIGWEC